MTIETTVQKLRADSHHMTAEDRAMMERVHARLFPERRAQVVLRARPTWWHWTAMLIVVVSMGWGLGGAAGTLWQAGNGAQAVVVAIAALGWVALCTVCAHRFGA